MPSRKFSGLNPPQHDAVMKESGPLLVLAGAGTGKTRMVTYRIARLIELGIRPERILAVTFTNKAANEMKERVQSLIKKRRGDTAPEISTFHSLCVRILRRHIEQLGYPQRFTIYATGQQESLARRVLREVQVPSATLKPSELLYFISRWKCQTLSPKEASTDAENEKELLAAAAYRRYQRTLKSLGAVDFDDLLLLTDQLFAQHAEIRREEAARFDHILIDEYQDTNQSQYRIVKALAARHRNLCVVGDDDQSIYGWRGAEVQHILQFKKDWPEAQVVSLEDNYRSTSAILEWANRLIQCNLTRHPKTLHADREGGSKPRVVQHEDEATEARETVAEIRRRLQSDSTLERRDIAILFRTNEQPRAFEQELRRADIPYVLVGGMSFFDRKEVRDVMAYIQVLDDPDEEMALRRAINNPPRGIGPKAMEQLASQALATKGSLWTAMKRADQLTSLSSSHRQAVRRFVDTIEDHRSRLAQESAVSVVKGLIGSIQYRAELERLFPEEQERDSRWNIVEELVNGLGDYEKRSRGGDLGGFLDDLLLSQNETSEDKEKQLRRNAVALMTLHAAKGLEFPHVYMVGMENGILPHQRSIKSGGSAIEEERRLCYVGVTRAQDTLTLSLALGRRKWGKLRPTDPSDFLYELAGIEKPALSSQPHKGRPHHHRKGARATGRR